eukprot:TRINITY_DN417_c0_g1_i1.p1 TRINITY_DN417_c0_g1~~TRINITY_DN417_c0_g1_i1.p1  ORF type:complete len:492 (-),score=86.32 TRINITY_DN417_c0_g1_i1:346-1821(-)
MEFKRQFENDNNHQPGGQYQNTNNNNNNNQQQQQPIVPARRITVPGVLPVYAENSGNPPWGRGLRRGASTGGFKTPPVNNGWKPGNGRNAVGRSEVKLENARECWKLTRDGDVSVTVLNKFALCRSLGVQMRDFRILDPQLSVAYPSAILCRDKALVINLEHIKALISTDYVLVFNTECSDDVVQFTEELKRRFTQPDRRLSISFPILHEADKWRNKNKRTTPDDYDGSELSFELRVLEVCLEAVVKFLNESFQKLESSIRKALDDLTLRIDPKNLERVRKMKTSLVRFKTHVETVKEVLEHYLNNDQDMKDVNLSGKDMLASPQNSVCGHSLSEHRSQSLQRSQISEMEGSTHYDAFDDAKSASSSSSSSSLMEEIVNPVEMLLEAYYMPVDQIWNRVEGLEEYVDDTEDYINMQQDYQRNQLILLELGMTSATLAVGVGAMIAGIFGMNLTSGWENGKEQFMLVSIVIGILMFVVLGTVAGYMKYRRII